MKVASKNWSLPEHSYWGIMVTEPYQGECSRRLTLYLKGVFSGSLEMESSDTIQTLCETLGCGEAKFIHNGRILAPAFSLAFQGVKNCDEIFVISEAPQLHSNYFYNSPYNKRNGRDPVKRLKERFDAKWAGRFRDPDSVFEQIRDASDPMLAPEAARIADIFRTRVESNLSAYRKVCDRFSRIEDMQDSNKENNTNTVIPEKALCPSTDYLPELWLPQDAETTIKNDVPSV